MKWSAGRFWTWRLNILWYTDLMVNASTPTASRYYLGLSLVVPATTFILMTPSGSTVFLAVPSLAPLPMSWSCEYAKMMEVMIAQQTGTDSAWYIAGADIEDRKQAEDRLRRENVALREEIDKASMFEEILGTSPALKSALLRISKVAPTDSTVLITGETGTG